MWAVRSSQASVPISRPIAGTAEIDGGKWTPAQKRLVPSSSSNSDQVFQPMVMS